MIYLTHSKAKKKYVAHIWTGKDTVCRMWSTGGLKKHMGWVHLDNPAGLKVCAMCRNVSLKPNRSYCENDIQRGLAYAAIKAQG